MSTATTPETFPIINQGDKNLKGWLDKYDGQIKLVKSTVSPEVYDKGHLYFIPLAGKDLATTLKFIDVDPDTGFAKGANRDGEHTIVIAKSKSLKWAPGTPVPRAELTIYDAVTNNYCPADGGNTLKEAALKKDGLGTPAIVGIIGSTYTRGGFLSSEKNTNGILIWANPNVILSTVNSGLPSIE